MGTKNIKIDETLSTAHKISEADVRQDIAALVDAFLQLPLRKLLDVLAHNFTKTQRQRVLLYFTLYTSDTSHATPSHIYENYNAPLCFQREN